MTDPSAAPQGFPRWWASAAAIAGTLAIGCAGGVVAWLLKVPLPWMLGPLIATAAVGLAGGPIHPVREARTFGQVIVGASIGLQFTQALLLKIVLLTPLIVGVTLFSIVVGAINAMILMRLSGLDRTTAFFATTPGGVVEMMNQAGRYGAVLEPIAVTQTMRVSLIVLFAPLLVTHFSGGGARGGAGRRRAVARLCRLAGIGGGRWRGHGLLESAQCLDDGPHDRRRHLRRHRAGRGPRA